MATIARNGRFLAPTLKLGDDGNRNLRDLRITEEHLRDVREGMRRAVGDPGGTGYEVFHDKSVAPLGVEICGKTGTAEAPPQRADLNADGRVESNEIVREGYMAWFAGFAPADRPTIAFAVVVEYTQEFGARAAGPIARELIRLCKERGYVK
jgi:cell division protein FtsI/penicillin-binding protein 2